MIFKECNSLGAHSFQEPLMFLSLVAIVMWDLFAPPNNDVSESVNNKMLTTVNIENLGALAGEPANGTPHGGDA